MILVGIAIGRNTHALLKSLENNITVTQIPNSQAGVDEILELRPEKIIIAGNRRWAMPIAYALKKRGFESINFVSFKTPGQRGKVGSVEKQLKVAMEKGIHGRPYFASPQAKTNQDEPRSLYYKKAMLYVQQSNEVRRYKHYILNQMAILFPEVVKVKVTMGKEESPISLPQPKSDLFTKKMAYILDHPFPEDLEYSTVIPEDIQVIAATSMAKHIPRSQRAEEADKLFDYMNHYKQWSKSKKETMDSLKSKLQKRKKFIVFQNEFGDGDIVPIVYSFLGWKEWSSFREIRKFCGLDVSRIDARGKQRISRRRPDIRMYLYLMATRTKRAKEIATTIPEEFMKDEEIRKKKMIRIKRIERLLKYQHNNFFSVKISQG